MIRPGRRGNDRPGARRGGAASIPSGPAKSQAVDKTSRRGSATDAARRAAAVRLLVLDVDGVLTDGRLYFGPEGETLKVFDVKDGLGVKLLREAGIEVAILSARRSPIVDRRARELGIGQVIQGVEDKGAGLQELVRTLRLSLEQCGYVGDDWPDLGAFARAGFAATVADAVPEVRRRAHWVSVTPGGRGAVREVAEFILRAQGKFEGLLRQHELAGSGHA